MHDHSRRMTAFTNVRLLFYADHTLDRDHVHHHVIDAPDLAIDGLDLAIDAPNHGIDIRNHATGTQDRVTDTPGRANAAPDHAIDAPNLVSAGETAVRGLEAARVRDPPVPNVRPATTTKVDLVLIRAKSQDHGTDRRPNRDRDHVLLPRKY